MTLGVFTRPFTGPSFLANCGSEEFFGRFDLLLALGIAALLPPATGPQDSTQILARAVRFPHGRVGVSFRPSSWLFVMRRGLLCAITAAGISFISP